MIDGERSVAAWKEVEADLVGGAGGDAMKKNTATKNKGRLRANMMAAAEESTS